MSNRPHEHIQRKLAPRISRRRSFIQIPNIATAPADPHQPRLAPQNPRHLVRRPRPTSSSCTARRTNRYRPTRLFCGRPDCGRSPKTRIHRHAIAERRHARTPAQMARNMPQSRHAPSRPSPARSPSGDSLHGTHSAGSQTASAIRRAPRTWSRPHSSPHTESSRTPLPAAPPAVPQQTPASPSRTEGCVPERKTQTGPARRTNLRPPSAALASAPDARP